MQRHQGQAVEATLCEQAAMRATAEGAVDTAASLQAAIAKALAADARRGAFRQAAIAEALNTDSAQERKEKVKSFLIIFELNHACNLCQMLVVAKVLWIITNEKSDKLSL